MATQLFNADADLATIQDLWAIAALPQLSGTARSQISKFRRDYHKAMEVVIERTSPSVAG